MFKEFNPYFNPYTTRENSDNLVEITSVVPNSVDIGIYKSEIERIFAPLREETSYNACKMLLTVYDDIKNARASPEELEELVSPPSDTKYVDLFKSFTISRFGFFTDDKLKSSKIMKSDLYTVYKKVLRNLPINIIPFFCDFTPENPFILTSDATFEADKRSIMILSSKNREKYVAFNRCFDNHDYIIGFINLYKKTKLSIDHKNAIIIDKVHNKIIRFEPKPPGMFSFFTKKARHDISEDQVKASIKDRYDVDVFNFEYSVVYGNQATLSITNDAIFCTIYSLYAAILFTLNYDTLKRKLNSI